MFSIRKYNLGSYINVNLKYRTMACFESLRLLFGYNG